MQGETAPLLTLHLPLGLLAEVCRGLWPAFLVKDLRRSPWTHLWKGAQRQASLALSFTACTTVFLRPDDWQVAFE